MARVDVLNVQSTDIASINLERLLERLEHKILSPEADPRLLHSSYERAKASANLEHARTLLLQLEHSSSALKIQSRKQAAQASLLQKRALIKRLNERLHELGRLDTGDLPSEDDEEDLLGEDASPEPLPTSISTPADAPEAISTSLDRRKDEDTEIEPTLRNRRPRNDPTPSAKPLDQTAQTETLLTHHSHEQESLTSSLLQLAQKLKESSHSFAASLESEKSILERAGEGLQRNTGGMEAAERRMGMLRKMTEGRGWWGRMIMYAWIAGLWVAALVVVFVLPKLRF